MPKRRQARDSLKLERIVQGIAQLSRSDKEELLVILQAMLEAEENEQVENEQTLKQRTQYSGPKGGRGYYERKMIRNCGPYLYLRYWSGGKHRSVYLGKVPPSTQGSI